ncbi:MAG: glycoside hydrolase family 32 protein [Clostridia bacterium]|nr:glycoside hydrolase family 32 protein [Clostridia bacterium]
MISEALLKARKYEEQYSPYVPEETRPMFHVTGAIGWINDPNGFSVYKGEYHLFFQYHPYKTVWGPMHWGHVKTRDFIRWERLPAALAPDMPYDKDGCFSGSAIELPDGRHLLMYTGVREELREDGTFKPYQTQCLAVGDGRDYEKVAFNPVLTAADLPKGGSEEDFRDPRIWKEDDGYWAVAGNRPADGSGSILLFHSEDAFHWRYMGRVASNHRQYGMMWECPDYFRLDGRDVLLVSPQEMSPIGLEFHAGNGTVCIIGEADEKKHLIRDNVHAIDYGIDFYAPQTLQTPDGRRVMIAWMQNWDTSRSHPSTDRLTGQMTIPRELHVRDGRLIQEPVREIKNYYGEKISYRNVPLSTETNLTGIRGRTIDMTVNVRPANGSTMYRWFKLNLAKDGEHVTTIRFKPDQAIVRVDRSRCGYRFDIVHVRDFPVYSRHGSIKMRVILDRHSLELFVNDGEQAASFVLYTPVEADVISFEAEGEVLMDVDKYDITFDRKEE